MRGGGTLGSGRIPSREPRAGFRARNPPTGQHAKYELNLSLNWHDRWIGAETNRETYTGYFLVLYRLPGRLHTAMMTEDMWENSTIPVLYINMPVSLLLCNDSLFNDTFINCTNFTTTSSQETPGGPSVAGVLLPIIYMVVCIIGLGGNTLVIHIVLHYSKTES
ncbi:hypothetical protein DPEC_G00305220, partial [Dallia pectoralis]